MTPAAPARGRTAWARNLAAPARDFLSTETGGAIVLVCAIIGALAWADFALAGQLRARSGRPSSPSVSATTASRWTSVTGSTRA